MPRQLPSADAEVFCSLLRADFRAFSQFAFQIINPSTRYLPNWHMDAIAYHLQLAFEREIKRLIINVPPRYGKSVISSCAFPAWALGKDPALKFMCISYAQDLADRFARDTNRIFSSPRFKTAFPALRWSDRKSVAEMETTLNGSRFASSIQGALLGRGADFIVIDDPMKPSGVMSEAERNAVNEAYDGAIITRLNNRNEGVVILVHQRLSEHDLTGHVREQEEWVELSLPAIAPEPKTYVVGPGSRDVYHRPEGEPLHAALESLESLDAQRRRRGSTIFQAQWQQDPLPAGGNVIHRDWIHMSDTRPGREDFEEIVQSWDTASKTSETADYSVGMTFGILDRKAYLLDVIRGRWEYPDLRRLVIERHDHWGADRVLIEEASSGLHLGPDLKRSTNLPVWLIKPKGDKIMRAETHSAKLESGDVIFPKGAPWMDELVRELLRFPGGRHDDQVDALAIFLEYFARLQRNWRIDDARKHRRHSGRSTKQYPSRWYDRSGMVHYTYPPRAALT